MNYHFKRVLALVLCFCALAALFPAAQATESTDATETTAPAVKEAENISSSKLIAASEGFPSAGYLFDGKTLAGGSSHQTASMTLEYEGGIGSLYLIFRNEYGAYTVTDNTTGQVHVFGENNFLHEWLDIEGIFGTCPTSLTLSFDNGCVMLNELYVFTSGETPDFVQKWEAPVEDKTDLILFSTHGDDEQLFFAGLLPYYANALDYQVQVVYLTNHRNLTDQRVHEMLNGLWGVGCTTYPVFGEFYDFLLGTKEATYQRFKELGVSRDDIIEYCLEQIRRFKPLVVVAHDFAGEYEHGQHMVYADCVAAALEISNDPEQFPELAEAYGTWDVPKAYFHLYEENPIVMDWDTPMEELDGLTPFQVTQKYGYPCHESQQWTWFTGWLNGKTTTITKATEIATYSPCEFGLYRTTVGPDVEKNDFFENLTTYAEQERLEQERIEQELLAQQQATETQATEDGAVSALDQFNNSSKSDNTVQQSEDAQARQDRINKIILGAGFGLIALLLIYNLWQDRQRKHRRKNRTRPKMEEIEK